MAATRDLQLNSGMRCAKYMLLIVSFMFAITAILLVMVGSTIQAIFGDFRQFETIISYRTPALLIAIGFILLFRPPWCLWRIKESVMLINLYGVCLFLVFILEVSASIAAFVMQGQVPGVDFMQSGLECCGVDGPKDWIRFMNQTNNNIDRDITVPYSCCGRFSLDDVTKCEYQYENGCYGRMDFIISQSTMLIATGATTVAFVQLLGAICAFMACQETIEDATNRYVRHRLAITTKLRCF
ncbi:hypothetical protein DOY81_011300 [Sarcophaga bullata]|nr:hypothetical protein DOY81_011300 [Sarcophaga bullata]